MHHIGWAHLHNDPRRLSDLSAFYKTYEDPYFHCHCIEVTSSFALIHWLLITFHLATASLGSKSSTSRVSSLTTMRSPSMTFDMRPLLVDLSSCMRENALLHATDVGGRLKSRSMMRLMFEHWQEVYAITSGQDKVPFCSWSRNLNKISSLYITHNSSSITEG